MNNSDDPISNRNTMQRGVHYNITRGTSAYSGSPYMKSRDQLYHVMTSSDSQ